MTVIRRLPGRARLREEVLREYQESNAKVRSNIPAVLWDFFAPDPDQFYRWRVQLDCGCIQELLTLVLTYGGSCVVIMLRWRGIRARPVGGAAWRGPRG
jgi:hypothetical protein